ncbi:sce7725 family protein [Loigolactobacillus jiayinensis]|uniref:Sce7725 family protein n=1 Tax=Loigolactobacillus jiayinensis TaxID=2486016 RepID=A0ABW1RI95_9LACO|nr:sce7725 family protein [Loigolactobacillus jiayinensis]
MTIYYPYLRGKQFELQALLALLNTQQLPATVIPIIEPVRDSRYLVDCVAAFVTARRPLIVIVNPQVGTYEQHRQQRFPLTKWWASPWLRAGLLVSETVALSDYQAAAVLIYTQPTVLLRLPAPQPQQLVIVGPSHRLWRQLNAQVTLTDPVPRGWDGADYLLQPRTFFGDQPWFSDTVGFSDFVIAGAGYSEKGYPLPYVRLSLSVPYHRQLWLQHFISTDFSDFKQPKAKYFSAGTQLMAWLAEHPEMPSTQGLQALEQSLREQHFPGLGKVKQWLLMHHIELVGSILSITKQP